MSEYMVVAGAAAGRADLVTAQLLLRCFYVNRRLHLPQPAALGAAVRLAADGAAAPPATPAAKAQRMFLLVDLLGSVAKIAQTRPPAPAPAAGAAGAAQASGGAGAPGELGAGGAAPAAPAQAPQPQRQGQGSGPWSDEARGRRAGVPAGVDPEDVAALGTAALLGLLAGGPRHPRQMHFLPVTLRNLGILGAGLVEPDLAAAALALAGAEAAGYNDMQLDQAAAALQLWRGAPCALSLGIYSDGPAGPAARRLPQARAGLGGLLVRRCKSWRPAGVLPSPNAARLPAVPRASGRPGTTHLHASPASRSCQRSANSFRARPHVGGRTLGQGACRATCWLRRPTS